MTLRFGKTDFLNNITTRRRTAVVFYLNLVISFLNTYNAAFLVVVIKAWCWTMNLGLGIGDVNLKHVYAIWKLGQSDVHVSVKLAN